MFSAFTRTPRRLMMTGSAVCAMGLAWASNLGALAQVSVQDHVPKSTYYLWNRELMTLHYTTDVVIALSYLAITVTLTVLYVQERGRCSLAVIFMAFGFFILASGCTYAMDVVLMWRPLYWLAGDLKLLTAVVALTTAIVLPDLLPRTRRLIGDALLSRMNERRFLAASDSSRDAFFILESVRNAENTIVDFRFIFVNQPAARLLNSTPAELRGKLLCESYPINRNDGFFDRYKQVVETGEPLQAEFAIDAENINATWLSHQVVKLEDGVAITTTDISAFKANEQRLLYMAHRDPLTGLAERRYFEERLRNSLQTARRDGHQMGLLVVDCDNFKRQNDLLGHQTGDALLVQFAARLKACVSGVDTVARVGGDEFMVVLSDLQSQAEATAVARQMLERLQEPIVLEGNTVKLTASIGVCVYPDHMECATDLKGTDCVTTLLKNADAAMYRAKLSGRNRVQVFTQEMANSLARHRRVDAQLQHAIEADELALVYQPRVGLLTGLVTGVEVLLRWRNAQLGVVMPSEFIPIAEESGMIVPIGRWVVEQACCEMRQLAISMGRLIPFAVNVSSRQFQQENLADEIAASLARYQINPCALELELTESMLLEESPQSKANFAWVRAHGVSIAIDDFGTGYSSMSYLTRLPVDRLKIDQSFVRRMNQDGESEAICKAIIGLGKALNVTVVGEGVESERHRDQLRSLGCDEAQGYLYARPMPLAELPIALRLIEYDRVSQAA